MLINNKLRIRKKPRYSLKNPCEEAIVRTEFRINQFITLSLMDAGNNFTYTVVSVNERKFNLYKFSFKEIFEILNGKNDYSCMDEACIDLIGTYDWKKFMGAPETMFLIYCEYIKAWINHNYDARLLRKDDAFPILKALYEAGDTKATEVFKLEITKRFLSGYFPVITYLISEGYLKYFEFEEIIWLFEQCIKIVGSHNYSALKTQIFWFLRDTGINYFYNENFEKAIKYLNDALKFCPFDIEILNKLGIAYLRRSEYELARALFEKAIKLPSSDDILYKNNKCEALHNLGKSYNRLHLFNKAINACNRAMDLDWENMNAWDQITIAYEGMGDFKRAKEAQKNFKKKANKMKTNLGRRRIRLFVKIRRINEKKMKKMEKRILKRRRINEIKIRFE